MTYLIVGGDDNEVLKLSKTFNPADVFWIKRQPDKKEITVADVAHFISQTQLASVSGKKLFIVFEAELMNTAAQNKLLKTIEDANDDTTVMFLCKTLTGILPTIRSRCIIRYAPVIARRSRDEAIATAATKLLNSKSLDEAIPHLPITDLDVLTEAVRSADFPPQKKHALYKALADIARNTNANCNPTNAFDLFLMALFQ